MRPVVLLRAMTGSPALPPPASGTPPMSVNVFPPSVERAQPVKPADPAPPPPSWRPVPPAALDPESLYATITLLPYARIVVSLCVKKAVPLLPLLLLVSLSTPPKSSQRGSRRSVIATPLSASLRERFGRTAEVDRDMNQLLLSWC